MKSFNRFIITCLIMISSSFTAKATAKKAFEKLSHDSLINIFSILEPKKIAELQPTSKEFKKVSEKVYPNVPLKTLQNIMNKRCRILPFYNRIRNFDRDKLFVQEDPNDDSLITQAYILAIQTKNNYIKKKLEKSLVESFTTFSVYESEIQEDYFGSVFYWINENNLLPLYDQTQELITFLQQFPVKLRKNALLAATDLSLQQTVQQMINSPDYMNGIHAKVLKKVFYTAILSHKPRTMEGILKQLLDTPKCCNLLVNDSPKNKGFYFHFAAINGLIKTVKQLFHTPGFIDNLPHYRKTDALRIILSQKEKELALEMLNNDVYMRGIESHYKRTLISRALENDLEEVALEIIKKPQFEIEVQDLGDAIIFNQIKHLEFFLKYNLFSLQDLKFAYKEYFYSKEYFYPEYNYLFEQEEYKSEQLLKNKIKELERNGGNHETD